MLELVPFFTENIQRNFYCHMSPHSLFTKKFSEFFSSISTISKITVNRFLNRVNKSVNSLSSIFNPYQVINIFYD